MKIKVVATKERKYAVFVWKINSHIVDYILSVDHHEEWVFIIINYSQKCFLVFKIFFFFQHCY
jgi:hypothetical protein